MTPEERYERFEEWLGAMSDALDTWMAGLPPELSAQLDYSTESLSTLEAWLIAQFPDARAAVTGDSYLVGDGAARYVGETFRKNFGGTWDMDVHDPNSLVFGTPSMRGFPRGGIPVAPLRLVVNALTKRDGNYFAFIAKHLV